MNTKTKQNKTNRAIIDTYTHTYRDPLTNTHMTTLQAIKSHSSGIKCTTKCSRHREMGNGKWQRKLEGERKRMLEGGRMAGWQGGGMEALRSTCHKRLRTLTHTIARHQPSHVWALEIEKAGFPGIVFLRLPCNFWLKPSEPLIATPAHLFIWKLFCGCPRH